MQIQQQVYAPIEQLNFDGTSTWFQIAATILVIVAIPKLLGLRTLNGMLNAQVTLLFNCITMLGGLNAGLVGWKDITHFVVIEFSFWIAILHVYKLILRKKTVVLAALKHLFAGSGAYYITSFMGIIALFNYIQQRTDGLSRIGYMTEDWFSVIKPFIQVATPLSYIGVFLLLLNHRRRLLAYILLLFSILASVFTGSKASFVLSLAFAFLAVRDLAPVHRIVLSRFERVFLLIIVVSTALYILNSMSVTANDLLDRFIYFGEANMLTYFTPDPTAACANVSIFARMHRGWARLLGDATALDIDTLFGFALMIQAIGVNALTGPNARISAYFVCNFPDIYFVFGFAVVFAYLVLIRATFLKTIKNPIIIALYYPFVLRSLHESSQDFNLIMQDITLTSVLMLILLVIQRWSR